MNRIEFSDKVAELIKAHKTCVESNHFLLVTPHTMFIVHHIPDPICGIVIGSLDTAAIDRGVTYDEFCQYFINFEYAVKLLERGKKNG